MIRLPKKEFRKEVGPPVPLTKEEAEAARREEEARSREELRCLRESYREHEAELRRLEAMKKKRP